jgi:ubiquinone/menaquinone biosynthesis C-methylase UbiE
MNRRRRSSNPCKKSHLFNNKVYQDCITDDGFDYEKFYNGINYVSPGVHLEGKGYYDICMKYVDAGEKWLDVGCGSGLSFSKAVENGIDAYGIDVVDKSIKKSNDRGIKAVKCSACERYPYPDEYFDFISVTDVLEHLLVDDVLKALKEIHRVQKKGKFLLLASCADTSERAEDDWKKHFHLTLKTKDEWLEMYLDCGFSLVENSVSDAFILRKV